MSLEGLKMTREYKVFITHSWEYHDLYKKVIDLLNKESDFKWTECSSPDSQPSHAYTDKEFEFELYYQLKPVHVVIALAPLYVSHKKWIKKEIDMATEKFDPPKPIISLESWGAERTPPELTRISKELVGWTSLAIVKAIKEHALPDK